MADLHFTQENMIKFEGINNIWLHKRYSFRVNFLSRTKFRYSCYDSHTRTIASDDEGYHEVCYCLIRIPFYVCFNPVYSSWDNSPLNWTLQYVHQQSKLGSETLGFSRVWHKKSWSTIHFYGLDNYVALMREIMTCLSLENCTYHEHIFSIQEVNGTSYQSFEKKKNAGLGKVNFFIWRIKVESEMKRKCV